MQYRISLMILRRKQMIKVPKEVTKVMKALTDAGFDNYAVGECVINSLVGEKTYAWDIVTPADLTELKQALPEAGVLSEKYSVLRMELVDEVCDEKGELLGEEGMIIDIATYRTQNAGVAVEADEGLFTDKLEADLARRDFTVDAIAVNPYVSVSSVVDPYGGREDIRKKLVRTIGDADKAFKEEPLRMIKAVRYAAQFGFDLSKSVYEAIVANYRLLENVRAEKLRDEFSEIMGAVHAGKGLNMLMDTGIIRVILGEKEYSRLTHREKSDLMQLCEGIERTKPIAERRLGLFYSLIGKKRALPSIERLHFDEETHQHLVDAVYDMAKLYFTAQPQDLKKFIFERSMDRYEYLLNIEKAQRLALGYDSETKIRSKIYMLGEIKKNGEAIFVEDLAVDANDLIEAGICTRENAEKMLVMLAESTHVRPKQNTREELLKLAKKYKRNKISAWGRGVSWLR